MKNISTLTDKDLLTLCRKYGTQAILWKRKFIGLLPEVDRRGLYLKKRCSSVYEFAAKFGGVTKKHTQRVIQVDKAFAEKGVEILREMLQEGAASISKLIKVVSVVTIENESDLVFAVKNLSHESLETYVRDMRHTEAKRTPERERRRLGEHDDNGMLSNDGTQIENGLFEPLFEGKSVRPNTFANGEVSAGSERKIDRENAEKIGSNEVKVQDQKVALKKLQLNLSEKMLDELLELQGKGIDIDVLLKEFLQKREGNIAEKKEETVRKVTGREKKRRSEGKKPAHTARSLPCEVRWRSQPLLKEEFGTKCAVGGCGKAATQIHHTVPFSINGSNSPDLLRPLCRAHHDIVHSVNAAYVGKKGMVT